MILTVKNKFHNTESRCFVKKTSEGLYLKESTRQRLIKKLCGIKDCQCPIPIFMDKAGNEYFVDDYELTSDGIIGYYLKIHN